MEVEDKDLGTLVRTARQTLGWGQSRLAKHLDVTQATVSRIESGSKSSKLVGRAFRSFLADVTSGALVPEPETAEASP